MGGHQAWRKRVAAGEPAKGRGGAICRHRPHLGRKGKDLKLNRKGNIAAGNPKKKKQKEKKEQVQHKQDPSQDNDEIIASKSSRPLSNIDDEAQDSHSFRPTLKRSLSTTMAWIPVVLVVIFVLSSTRISDCNGILRKISRDILCE